MKICVAVVLMFAFCSCSAATLALGLQTHHFQPTPPDECLNESHDLVAIEVFGIVIGTYDNSHCRTSFLMGRSWRWDNGFGFDTVFVTGYPSKMHLLGKLILIPQATYSKFWGDYGLKVNYVPTVLTGVGFVYKI